MTQCNCPRCTYDRQYPNCPYRPARSPLPWFQPNWGVPPIGPLGQPGMFQGMHQPLKTNIEDYHAMQLMQQGKERAHKIDAGIFD